MGSSESRLYKPPTLNHQSWREGKEGVSRERRTGQGNFRVLVNKLTNEQLEEYLLYFQSLPEFQRYLEFFRWREREDSVVNAKYLNYKLGNDFCATSYTANVYIERIPVRLIDIEDIPFPQNIYVLLSALDGFEKLYRIVGYFRPTEDLICMDRDGRVKAWLHPDLSLCLPQGCPPEEAGLRREETLQARMVEEIVRLVEDNTAHDPAQSLTVTDYLRRNHRNRPITFRDARLDIISYAEEFHAEIPNYFESVVGLFDEEPSQKEEESARPPPFLRNEKDSEAHVEQARFHHEAADNWPSQPPRAAQLEGRQTEKGSEYSRDKVSATPPVPANNQRPNSALYSLVMPPPSTYQENRPAYFPINTQNTSNAKVIFNYQQQPQVHIQTQFLPHFYAHPQPQPQPQAQLSPLPPPPLFVPYQVQSLLPQQPPTLQAPQINPNPASPIMQLTSPVFAVKKATSLVPEESDRTQLQEKFDAKLVLSSSLKHLLSGNNRLIYSDSTSTYQLDEELAEDMVKYLTAES